MSRRRRIQREEHSVPLNDTKEHVRKGMKCSCLPERFALGDDVVIVHNAFDGRDYQLGSGNPRLN
jgi:hypothetical protein